MNRTVKQGAAAMDMYVAAGFEPVREAFEQGVTDLSDGGGAFCAYVDGAPVVDLWGGTARPGEPWASDTRAVLMSLTKGLAALCVQILVDRGQVDVDAPVSAYWPEFAAGGKEKVLVRHVLTHTAGVLSFPGEQELLGLDGTGWDDYDAIAKGLAAAAPSWEPGTRFGYHALTFGWLLGEIVRRVTGRRVGVFFHEEVAEPLGLDTRIGTPSAEQRLVAHVRPFSFAGLPPQAVQAYEANQARIRDAGTLAGQAHAARNGTTLLDHPDEFFNNRHVLGLEIPSANGTSTAHGLARLFAMLAMGGELDGVRLLSPQTVRAFGTVQVRSPDATSEDDPGGQSLIVPWGLGYIGNFAAPGRGLRYGPVESAFGSEGGGGQIAFCDPEHRISVGFVRSQFDMIGTFSAGLIDALYRCVGDS